MRATAPIGLLLILSGCANYAGSPFDGFGGFIGDTHSFTLNPNRPIGDSETMRRVAGLEPQFEPLLPEPGNVWPGPLKPEPTLADLVNMSPEQLEKQGLDLGTAPDGQPLAPRPPRTGGPTPLLAPPSGGAPGALPGLSSSPGASNTPATRPGAGGVKTFTDGQGRTGIVVPNGNGTSTLILPDGSVQTIPTPK